MKNIITRTYKIFAKFILSLIGNLYYTVKFRTLIIRELENENIDKRLIHSVLSTTETLRLIIEENKSITRFGEGELNLVINRNGGCCFQKFDAILRVRMLEILQSTDDNILVSISPFKINNKVRLEGRKFWVDYWCDNIKYLKDYFVRDSYGNTFFSRVMTFYENDLEYIKQAWNDRDVVFVYGKNGKFANDERVFGNIKSYEEIIIPARDAFDDYDNIFQECMQRDKSKLFLIAAGPTATVLAYDLAKVGYQALDIGHLPNSYHQYLGEIYSPEDLPIEK